MTTTKRSKAGRPPFSPTDAQRVKVQVMAACGMPHDQISAQIVNPQTGRAIDAKTLRAHFRDELKTGKSVANALVAQSLFRKATGAGPQSVTAAIFWLKTQAGWKEAPSQLAFTDPDGNPVKPPSLADFYAVMRDSPQAE